MTYTPTDILTPICELIQSCPFRYIYDVGIEQIETEKSDAGIPNYVLDLVSSDIINTTTDTWGRVHITRQDNINFQIVRMSNNEYYRKNASLFMHNFIQWLDLISYLGETPKFGDIENDEKMWASGGMAMGYEDTGSGITEASYYIIQLHMQYTKIYGEKE